ncbi:hypothetical protein CBOM_02749 [Ceraceosorus bombacis]|uniref:Uncharacterized protein n=1 Tax=Ceraceosorus bombacis TaxID=401625 RepID=A0A0N7L9W7_9BASI|nr:hypothetical protein CBOM_02749 [Ceraceosorus bombacis]
MATPPPSQGAVFSTLRPLALVSKPPLHQLNKQPLLLLLLKPPQDLLRGAYMQVKVVPLNECGCRCCSEGSRLGSTSR